MSARRSKYSDTAIKALISAIDGDQEANQWLMENDFKELSALKDVLNENNDSALHFLLSNKRIFPTIVNFIGALQQDDKARDELMITDDKVWAATASAVNGDEGATNWLLGNNFNIYADLANLLAKNSNGPGSFKFGDTTFPPGGGTGLSGDFHVW